MAKIRSDVPSVYSFPPVLKFVAEDGSGNEREVTYYRADVYLNFSARVEDVFSLPKKIREEKDWGERDG